jgi:hypothetical protein
MSIRDGCRVGLGKLKDYISNWGMTWSAEEYIKKPPDN